MTLYWRLTRIPELAHMPIAARKAEIAKLGKHFIMRQGRTWVVYILLALGQAALQVGLTHWGPAFFAPYASLRTGWFTVVGCHAVIWMLIGHQNMIHIYRAHFRRTSINSDIFQ